VHVERYLQVAELLQHRCILRVVEEGRARAASQQRSLEAKVVDGPVELGCGGRRLLPWQHGESAQPGRVRADSFCQPVVGGPGEGHGLVCGCELGWRDARHDLQLNAVIVHRLDPALAEVGAKCYRFLHGHR
jgi:hypothetical protein